jgi:NADPH:quinone reductase
VNVIGVVSTQAKYDTVSALGAHAVLNSSPCSWPQLALEASGGIAPRWIFDSVGLATFEDSLTLLATRGHLVLYGAASGAVPAVAIPRLMAKSATLSRPVLPHYMSDLDEAQRRANRIFDKAVSDASWFEFGASFQLDSAQQAHRDLASRDRQGKLLLEVYGEL